MEEQFFKPSREANSDNVRESDLFEHDLSFSLVSLLKRNGIYNLKELSEKSKEEIRNFKGISSLLMQQLKDVMEEHSIEFKN